jgi:16S rRNA (cytidine1402-2'-O)-methyltransferase
MEKGKLYIVSTPIGNLKDMTFRAIETLKLSDFIIAEDTRVTQNLLNHYAIATKLISYHKFNEKEREESIIDMLKTGKTISLVSDAGTPLLSDPGYVITKACVDEGIDVEAIPGASSALSAMILSGFNPGKFLFYGFLPKKEGERHEEIKKLADYKCPVILFEAPGRVKDTLLEIKETIGDVNAAVAKELTKVYEKVLRGKTSEIMEQLTEDMIKGEFVIIIDTSAAEAVPEPAPVNVSEKISVLLREGKSKSEAVKITAKQMGMKKSDVYKIAHMQ